MLKKVGFPILTLAAMLLFVPAKPAQAGIRFGIGIGGPVVVPAPVVVAPAPVYPPAYVAPAPVYPAPAPVYVAPAPIYPGWGWGGGVYIGGPHYVEHGFIGHGFRGRR